MNSTLPLPFSLCYSLLTQDFARGTVALHALLEQITFETLHSELAAKMHFASSSFARTRLAPSSVRAFSK